VRKEERDVERATLEQIEKRGTRKEKNYADQRDEEKELKGLPIWVRKEGKGEAKKASQ